MTTRWKARLSSSTSAARSGPSTSMIPSCPLGRRQCFFIRRLSLSRQARQGCLRQDPRGSGRPNSSRCSSGCRRPVAASWRCWRDATRPARAARSTTFWPINEPAQRACRGPDEADGNRARGNGITHATSPIFRRPAIFVLFDRSWYNRAGVEPVMGFCTPEEYERFLAQTPRFEKCWCRTVSTSSVLARHRPGNAAEALP